MRSFICLNRGGRPYKLAWFNEDSKGVYIGMYGAVAGFHFSYHSDGTRHSKGALFPEPILQHNAIPIAKIETFQQVVFQLTPLSDEIIAITGFEHTKEDDKASTAMFLDEAAFPENTLAVDAYLVNRTCERDFLDFLFRRFPDDQYSLVSLVVQALEFFPKHKLGLALLTGKGVIPQQRG